MDLYETKRASQTLFTGRVLTLQLDQVELPDGRAATREVVRHGGGVCVLALDACGQVLFVRQYRYPYAEVLLELPAGKLEKGEAPAVCGMRELEEETGYAAGEVLPLGVIYPSPGYADEVLHLFFARSLMQTVQRLDADEFLMVEKIPFEKAVEACVDGSITDAKTVAAVLKYNELRRRGAL